MGAGGGRGGRQVEVDPGAISVTFSLPHHLLMRVKKNKAKKQFAHTHTDALRIKPPRFLLRSRIHQLRLSDIKREPGSCCETDRP